MSRYLPNEVFELDPAPPGPKPHPSARLLDVRGWMFLGMGLAGILTVALIVTADESYAGIDGMRAVRALVPEIEQDVSRLPFLGGIIGAIHDVAPTFLAPSPDSVAAVVPATASPRPANSPSSLAQPTVSAVPTAQLPAATTPSPAPSASPSAPAPTNTSAPVSVPTPTATPTPAPTATPTPTPSPTPTPTLVVSTDRGATAVVNLADLVPGDSVSRTITVQNGGDLAFRYTVSATQTASTLLWTDVTDGLQLTVATSGGAVLYSGPLSGLGFLAGPTTLAPGTSELLRYTFDFPPSASNAFQGLVQDLTVVFDAVEFP